MVDLISRSYILKIIEMWMKVPSYSESERNIMRAIDYEVRTAPSAEPEIIHCGECAYAEVADPDDGQDGYVCQFHPGSIWFSGSFCSWAKAKMEVEE